jgi:hypothetical protein
LSSIQLLIHETELIWGRWRCKLFTVPAVQVGTFILYLNLGTPPIFNILHWSMLYLASISMVVISNTAQISFTSVRLCIAKDIVRTLLFIRKTGPDHIVSHYKNNKIKFDATLSIVSSHNKYVATKNQRTRG